MLGTGKFIPRPRGVQLGIDVYSEAVEGLYFYVSLKWLQYVSYTSLHKVLSPKEILRSACVQAVVSAKKRAMHYSDYGVLIAVVRNSEHGNDLATAKVLAQLSTIILIF